MASRGCRLVADLVAAASLGAQGLPPESHWGGNIAPADRPELRASFRFDRFTEFSKTGQEYNEIETTAGFNLMALSYTENTPGDPDLFFTVTGGVGYGADQPTRWLQNDYVHRILGQLGVPVGATRDEIDYAASGSLTRWFDGPLLWSAGSGADATGWRTRFFAGAGIATSTIYHEAFAHVGATLLVPETFVPDRRFRFGLSDRLTFPTGDDMFGDVASVSNVTQASFGLVPVHVHSDSPVLEFLGNPEFGITVTYDTGFFQRNGSPIETWFAGFYVQWPTGLRFETWNDFANGTDFGPTYGFQVSFDVFTLFKNSRWRW